MQRETYPVVGGHLHGAEFDFERYGPEDYSLRVFDEAAGRVLVPSWWPRGREAEGIALVRVFGPDENNWLDAVAESFLGCKSQKGS